MRRLTGACSEGASALLVRGWAEVFLHRSIWAPVERGSKTLRPLRHAEGTAWLAAGPGELSGAWKVICVIGIALCSPGSPWWKEVATVAPGPTVWPHSPRYFPHGSSPHPKTPRTRQDWQLAGSGLSLCHCSQGLLSTELRLVTVTRARCCQGLRGHFQGLRRVSRDPQSLVYRLQPHGSC